MENNKIRVAELFAGVGGFHLGLKRASDCFDIVWANQYEPSRKNQFAFNIYRKRFPKTDISNKDISKLDKSKIPPMNLLVGGFPCQDYSVASSGAKGLYGKKGVLWWDIRDIVKEKAPQFIFLENVDRLLSSPGVKSNNPGRDFGMILKTLSDLNYGVSWKVINAADYGFPQKRRRTFIFAFRGDTAFNRKLNSILGREDESIQKFICKMEPFSNTLENDAIYEYTKVDLNGYASLADFSENFSIKKGFKKTGVMINGKVFMANYEPRLRRQATLGSIIEYDAKDRGLYLSDEKIEKFKQLKSGFQAIKVSRTGFEYKYGMGNMRFPDSLEEPARTIVTSEHSVSRMSHVVKDPGNGEFRIISPEETELINTFPREWTKVEGVTNSNRYFVMGNALVVDLVKEIGESINAIIQNDTLNSHYKFTNIGDKISH